MGTPVFFELCGRIDEIRREYEPFTDLIFRCYRQGLSVLGCIWYIQSIGGFPQDGRPETLNSEERQAAIRELLWRRTSQESHPLLKQALGLDQGSGLESARILDLITAQNPNVSSWVPAAYRSRLAHKLSTPPCA